MGHRSQSEVMNPATPNFAKLIVLAASTPGRLDGIVEGAVLGCFHPVRSRAAVRKLPSSEAGGALAQLGEKGTPTGRGCTLSVPVHCKSANGEHAGKYRQLAAPQLSALWGLVGRFEGILPDRPIFRRADALIAIASRSAACASASLNSGKWVPHRTR